MAAQDNNNIAEKLLKLNEMAQAGDASITQTQNLGMGAVGESAADIEIYMGDMSDEMHAGTGPMGGGKPGVMGGGGGTSQQKIEKEQEAKTTDDKQETTNEGDEKDQSKSD